MQKSFIKQVNSTRNKNHLVQNTEQKDCQLSKIKDCNFCQLKQKPSTDIKLLQPMLEYWN